MLNDPGTSGSRPSHVWRYGVLEIGTSFVVSALFVLSCFNIKVDPMDRLGQVSGIASIEYRFLLVVLPLLAALVIAAKVRSGVAFNTTSRIVCAAIAGLATATVAGGIVVALRPSHFGLGGVDGDAGVLIWWADLIRHGSETSKIYPPGQTYLLIWISDLFGLPAAYGLKWFQVIGIAAVGPLSYATWRLLLRPGWALTIGIVSALPLIEAYKQYPPLVLIIFVPLAIRFLQVLRRSGDQSAWRLIQYGVLFGLALGILFLLYSGWFQWSAPGFMVAAAIVFPWRRGWRHGALFCGVASVVFALLTVRYLMNVAEAPGIKDDYVYFDALVEPAYIAMWRGDLPGNIGVWPPMGELAGVGVFTVLLAFGIGGAVVLGRGRTLVIGVSSIMAGTWLFRFYHARRMYETKLVQLYPRTTAELLYCAMILVGFAIYLAVERSRSRVSDDSPLRRPAGLIGALAGLVFLILAASSSIIDRYMPKEAQGDPGRLAWRAHQTVPLESNQTIGATVEASSAYEGDHWSKMAAIDHDLKTGYSSQLGQTADHEEWLAIKMPTPRTFSRIVLYPAENGFPIDFSIEVWDGERWLPRLSVTGYAEPHDAPQVFALPSPESTDQVRVRATKLRQVGADRVFRIAELELFI